MDSIQLFKFCQGFSRWYPFDQKCVQGAPEQHGVYIFRKARGQRFGRLQGLSDIMYIGSTKAKGGLKQRLRQYLHPGPTQWTNKRINAIAKKHEIEVGWYPCEQPGNLENKLLKQYLNEHDELPPLNHATKRKLELLLKEKFSLTNTKLLRRHRI